MDVRDDNFLQILLSFDEYSTRRNSYEAKRNKMSQPKIYLFFVTPKMICGFKLNEFANFDYDNLPYIMCHLHFISKRKI